VKSNANPLDQTPTLPLILSARGVNAGHINARHHSRESQHLIFSDQCSFNRAPRLKRCSAVQAGNAVPKIVELLREVEATDEHEL